jgi:hypothetical protein
MSRRAVILWVAVSIVLAAGAEPTPVRAQSVQGKTHVGGKPSGLVSLAATLTPGAIAEALVVTAEGGGGAPLVLPAGVVLVVTDVYAEGTGPAVGPRYVSACTGGGCVNAALRLAFDTSQDLSRSLALTSGVVFREPPQVSCAAASAGTVTVRLHGYLAKDK